MKTVSWFSGLFLISLGGQAGLILPVPERIGCAVPDRQDHQIPDRVYLRGWLGSRVGANESNRLVRIDTARLLEGYRQRPGRQAWDGEHVGKWLHAATLAWIYTGDPLLRANLDTTVVELCQSQKPDGYLGTYLDKDRWTEWDVWAHKYNLIGLITYMRYTGNLTPLPTCQRMADLLCATFGDQPGQRDLLRAGHHVGMAPTSVLEPMVLLYRLTGEARYLQFCQYILRAWELPHGPKILSTLLTAKRVDKVGNGKAYEMLSCLNGALEFYRTVGGRPEILEACLNAWADIVAKRLYITGAASYQEHFHDDFDLPNTGNVGETCVTVTWLQFNAQLLRLTGEARFAEQLELVCLNQLLGAQKPDGSAWGYYVQMEGVKPYSDTLDGHCCLSSGPRGVASIPTFAVTTDAQGVVVNLYDAGHANLALRNGSVVSVNIDTLYPKDGVVRIGINPVEQSAFAVKLRIPTWCRNPLLRVGGENHPIQVGRDGYAWISREWKPNDRIELDFHLVSRLAMGNRANQGKMAILYGPLVLAADQALLGGSNRTLNLVSLAPTNLADLVFRPEPATDAWNTWPGSQLFRVRAQARKAADTLPAGGRFDIRLAPFADAGMSKANYRVWLPLYAPSASSNLLFEGQENRSRPGNLAGSINDEDPRTLAVTFDGKPADEDWFAITLEQPATIGWVVFNHGRNFHDGGWFDTSLGQPRIQTRARPNDPWQTVGVLEDYPATTAANPGKLRDGQACHGRLTPVQQAVAVRVIGKPAHGDNPQQSFASCGELQAFENNPQQ